MKIIMLAFLLSSSVYANDKRVEVISAKGFKEITLGGMLNPFGGAVKGAGKIAKLALKQKCARELNGKITGEVTLTTLRFDEGIMGAVVEASGSCEY